MIKVISGVRRCGKSTLFILFQQYLRKEGIPDDNIIQLNFEQPEFMNIGNSNEVYQYLAPLLKRKGMKYIFLDEIQHVKNFEKIADALNTLEDVDLYITGSNGYLMSGELATLLTGRYVELKMFPLSFKEYIDGFEHLYPDQKLSKIELFNQYVRYGSFPFVLRLNNDPIQIEEYLDGIFTSIIYRDIQTRLQISDRFTLERIIKFMFDSIGSYLSIRKIANTITSMGHKITPNTVERYVIALLDSLIVYDVSRFDIHRKEQLGSLKKYYIVDTGLRYHLLASKKSDRGHLIENVVYFELLRRGFDVTVGSIPNGEVDFVARKNNETLYYQVSETVLDEKTLQRELKPFSKIDDHYPKYLLTMDEFGKNDNFNGIKQLNILDWLLADDQR